MPQEMKKRQKRKIKGVTKTDNLIDDTFNPANAHEKDFELDMEASQFRGKKGQAGTRSKSA